MSSLDFEDLCLDPYQANFDKGHREGSAAGLQAGYGEGRKLGQQKAVEVGIELGYMRGVAEAIRQDVLGSFDAAAAPSDDNNSCTSDEADATRRRVEKVGKSLDELLSMIDAFPSPDEIFHKATGNDQRLSSDDVLNDEEDDSERIVEQIGGPVDISGRMQRIRAKFKLLCVQLKVPEVGLSKVMEEAKKALGEGQKDVAIGGDISEQVNPGGDQDW
mmetsp:Transcript_28097/g.81222  ORF Transcript_28097/g.81222 Transcript_28097/m.81222 type:complete len:217 (+) Transcript_28097:84-734(+)|eukprot:CAMPEP_0181033214 /NCGR_PEP_ID=MMETSP1070-20121207/7137_1 /TAXON_ID=265543 /ORGANISM="Minutocellus polymorphus, Strain NH13" /LENGTH=216 /DNA_ID=CAMNT_0023110625 /DNA_START=43 /DNA_END=690 /DNA_ORIENTATION=-